ncbi:hypothetical protein PVL29_014396 [Vitis rotundifolia]|uniref:Longin domain-containing protein n=1 Tax=Vitis rotundifolia TaxID=103349 RepID=A0AA38ZGP0_VITRO|nr:hypothetical protein PVL29_014396 [Vitis rotundifolia]
MWMEYCMVGRGHVVLADFNGTSTNASVIARQMLENMAEGDTDNHASFSRDRYLFHVKRTDGLTLLCMADDALGRRIPFAFLEDIHQRFVKTYGRAIHSAPAYAMNDEFSRVLSQQMDHNSNDPNADRLNRSKDEMGKRILIKFWTGVTTSLELPVDKTATLQGNTIRFRKQARMLNPKGFSFCSFLNNASVLTLCCRVAMVLIIYRVLALFCRGLLLPSCLK